MLNSISPRIHKFYKTNTFATAASNEILLTGSEFVLLIDTTITEQFTCGQSRPKCNTTLMSLAS
jgi:hypothetical protein